MVACDVFNGQVQDGTSKAGTIIPKQKGIPNFTVLGLIAWPRTSPTYSFSWNKDDALWKLPLGEASHVTVSRSDIVRLSARPHLAKRFGWILLDLFFSVFGLTSRSRPMLWWRVGVFCVQCLGSKINDPFVKGVFPLPLLAKTCHASTLSFGSSEFKQFTFHAQIEKFSKNPRTSGLQRVWICHGWGFWDTTIFGQIHQHRNLWNWFLPTWILTMTDH